MKWDLYHIPFHWDFKTCLVVIGVFKIPLSFHYTGWLRMGFPYWIIIVPSILGSRNPELIMNQAGFSSHSLLMVLFGNPRPTKGDIEGS